jgi:hypothetical protein
MLAESPRPSFAPCGSDPATTCQLSRVGARGGTFVLLATLLLTAGFAWYIYQTGARKMVRHRARCTSLYSAAGLVGDR